MAQETVPTFGASATRTRIAPAESVSAMSVRSAKYVLVWWWGGGGHILSAYLIYLKCGKLNFGTSSNTKYTYSVYQNVTSETNHHHHQLSVQI